MNLRTYFPLTQYGISDVETLCYVNYNRSHPPLTRHIHRGSFEIVFFLSGEQTYFIDGSPQVLHGGHMLLSLPNEWHSTGNDCEEISAFYYMIFRFDDRRAGFLNFTPEESRYLYARLTELRERKFAMSAQITRILGAIFRQGEMTPLSTARVRTLLTELFLEMLVCFRAERRNACGDMPELIALISRAPERNYSVEELAGAVHLSPSRLKEKFKRYTGIPVMKFVTRVKIERAKQLLLESDRTITDIALDLGFCSSQHFSSVFKNYTMQPDSPVSEDKSRCD